MLTSKELREGNYHEGVEICHPRLGISSVKVSGKCVSSITAYGIHLVSTGEYKIRPLLITAEWLERFGFEGPGEPTEELKNMPLYYARFEVWTKNETQNRKNLGFEIQWSPYNELCTYGKYTNFKYVHELQNLFYSIVGEEIEENILTPA